MPYIPNGDRVRFLRIETVTPCSLGELDYCITRLVDAYLSRVGVRFDILAGVAGVLDYVSDETKRRVADDYERDKRETNGEVYFSMRKS